MKPILCNSGDSIELNALFIQPTRWCALNCKGCYVKEHSGGEDGYHTPHEEQVKLFELFYKGPHWANQITISIDDLPMGLDFQSTERRYHMTKTLSDICLLRRMDTRSKEDRPEVHMTFNTWSTYKSYITSISEMVVLDMISISHLGVKSSNGLFDNDLQHIKRLKNLGFKPQMNYNYLIPGNITSFNIDKHINHLLEAAQIVDSIYLVIFKTPIGKPRNALVNVGDSSRMTNDILFINTLMERVPANLKEKFHTDGCLQDVKKFRRTGFGCSSNVSRVQVWPDGSVSGCAYAFSGTRKQGRTAGDIVDNIREARKQYDFRERCHLPKLFSSLKR